MAWKTNTIFKGMNSLLRATTLPQGVCANSKNSDLGSSSVAAPMKQYTVFGHQANEDDIIVKKYTYVRGDGTEVQLQVRDNGTNYIVEYLNIGDIRNSENGEWLILEAGLSRSINLSDGTAKKARFSFAPFNDTGSNQLVYGNGIEAMRIWNGSMGIILSRNATTLTLSGSLTLAGLGFSASGYIMYNGTSYQYDSISGQTFTMHAGVNPSAWVIGAGITQSVDSSILSAADKGSILLSFQQRLFLAGITATPNQVTFSDVGDVSAYSGSNPSDGGFEDFPQMNGSITALSYLDSWIIVFSEKKIIAWQFQFPTSTTRITVMKDIADEGCSSYKAVKKMGDQVWYITPTGGLKRITQIASKDVFNVEDMTDGIRPTIENFIWDDASLEYLSKKRVFLMSGRSSSDVEQNDTAIMAWISIDPITGGDSVNLGTCDWFISDMCVYGGDIHFGSGVESVSYKAFDGYDKNGAPYDWVRTERVELFNNPWEKKWIKFLGVRGSIDPGTTLYITFKYDMNGTTQVQEMELKGNNEQFVASQPLNTLGGFELGTEPLGGTIENIGDLNPFKVKFELPAVYFEDCQLEFSTSGKGQQVVIDTYGFDVYSADQHTTADEISDVGLT